MDKIIKQLKEDNGQGPLTSCEDFKNEPQKRKNIDLADSIDKRLGILAVYNGRDIKNYLQDILTDHALKHIPEL